MFSFVHDTVLDPFAGSGTTLIAAASCQRNAIGVEVDPEYLTLARTRVASELGTLSLFGEPISISP
jgi:DNA modification methylase